MAAKKYVCKVCGYVHEGSSAPDVCPLCKAASSEFEVQNDGKKKKGLDTNNDVYAIIYSAVVVVIVAFLLAGVSSALKPMQDANVELDKKKQILASLNLKELKNATATYDSLIIADPIVDIEGKIVAENGGFYFPEDTTVVNQMVASLTKEKGEKPFVLLDASNNIVAETGAEKVAKDTIMVYSLYCAKLEDGSTKYILPMTGNGLWGGIWGYLALNDDCNTIYGVYFSHASETPGLGAEIAGDKFQNSFTKDKDGNPTPKKVYDENGNVALTVIKKSIDADYHVDAISGATITCNGVDGMLKSKLAPYYNYLKNQKAVIPATELVPAQPVANDSVQAESVNNVESEPQKASK